MCPLVSIIIPVYNPNKTLFEVCMTSVLGQSYSNLEVVIVDDGSTVDAGKYFDTIAESDCRIIVIHQVNQGVSAARNNGLKAANGDYVMYVDGDDVISPIAVEEGVNHILENEADLVIAGVHKIRYISDFLNVETMSEKHEILSGKEIDELRIHYLAINNPKYKNINDIGYISRGPYCKLIKRGLAVSNLFQMGLPIGEDLIWNLNLLDKCDSVCVIYNIWYGYLISPTSVIRKYHGNRIEKVEEYLKLLLNEHRDFCLSNIQAYGKNVAVEFYCILRYELLSPKCKLSPKEKNMLVKRLMKSEPWNLIDNKFVKSILPRKYRILFRLCKMNLWQPIMKRVYKEG